MKTALVDLVAGPHVITPGEAAALELDRNSEIQEIIVTSAEGHSYLLGSGELFPLNEIEYRVSEPGRNSGKCAKLLLWGREEALLRRPP